jgi:hypothetical protein
MNMKNTFFKNVTLKTFAIIFMLLILSVYSFGGTNDSFYNVKKYGAKGDGKSLDSKSINKAIDQAEK